MTWNSILTLTMASFFAAGGQLLFRMGAHGRAHLLEFFNLQIMSGLLLYVFGTAIWVYTLSSENLTNVYAFTALTFVLVYLSGALVLGERITTINSGGIILILAGLYMVTR
jgi:drug/metabolite transporter (DMT)-like permease